MSRGIKERVKAWLIYILVLVISVINGDKEYVLTIKI